MKQRFLSISPMLLLIPAMLTACHAHVHSPEPVGTYEFRSGNIATGQSCFSLANDGTYALGDAGDPLGQLALTDAPKSGRWTLHEDETGQQLILGHASLPIVRTSTAIRVKVNEPMGIYCDLPQQ